LLLNQVKSVKEALELKAHLAMKAYKHKEPRTTWASDNLSLFYRGKSLYHGTSGAATKPSYTR